MKIKNWSKNILWFVFGAGAVALLSFVSTSEARQRLVDNLLMRIGEQRVLGDGTIVRLSKGKDDSIGVMVSRPAPGATPTDLSPVKAFTVREAPAYSSSTLELIGSYEITIPGDDLPHDSGISLQPGYQLLVRYRHQRDDRGQLELKAGEFDNRIPLDNSHTRPIRYDLGTHPGAYNFLMLSRRNLTLRYTPPTRAGGLRTVVIEVEVRRLVL